MLGSDAAVTEMVSPSQLIPSDVHRMWISSVSGCAGATLVIASPLDRLRSSPMRLPWGNGAKHRPKSPPRHFPDSVNTPFDLGRSGQQNGAGTMETGREGACTNWP
ncbi:hypothetical protein GCM10010177_40500 [Actinomadura citrea]|nr:hypothetical protein GCM10010177_40500 [Actinomadura citrea]